MRNRDIRIKIEEIPYDSYTDLVINFDPRFQRTMIRHSVGVGESIEENRRIAEKIVNELGGEVVESDGLIYVYVPWRPDIYYTLTGEIEDIYRMKG
ncbi:MAG: hypothetical protein ACXQT3_01860 [Methermicoccaceae archaeon]